MPLTAPRLKAQKRLPKQHQQLSQSLMIFSSNTNFDHKKGEFPRLFYFCHLDLTQLRDA
jgi:hypothetical protein